MKILVTGCLGFIGSAFCKHVITENPETKIIGIARNPNPRNIKRLDGLEKNDNFRLMNRDLYKEDIYDLFDNVDVIYHFAARTFVDHSIRDPSPFIKDNIGATFKILEAIRKHGDIQKLFFISTDEVFGSILKGSYKEDARMNPTNPYSATKAAAEMLVISYYNTYGVPSIITRTENVFGPYQDPVKVFPVFIKKALNNEKLPIYGDGKHIRQWLYVEDKCRALLHLIEHGKIGEKYNIAGNQELENLELGRKILKLLGKPENMIRFVPDFNIRPGHDRRYALDSSKIRSIGWKPKWSLDEGIKYTVEWYKNNLWWLN